MQLGAIAVMWVLLFAAAYSLASGSSTRSPAPTSALATGSPVDSSALVGGASSHAKLVKVVSLPSVAGVPPLKLAPAPHNSRPAATVVASRPVTVTPVVPVTPVSSRPVVQPPVTSTPSSSGTQHSSSGSSHSTGSSGQSGTGTVSGGG